MEILSLSPSLHLSQSLVIVMQAFVDVYFVRLSLATALMTRLSDRWSDDCDHLSTPTLQGHEDGTEIGRVFCYGYNIKLYSLN